MPQVTTLIDSPVSLFITVRALEKARNSGQLSIDATAALLTSTDNLLSSSPSGDGLLESQLKQDPSSP